MAGYGQHDDPAMIQVRLFIIPLNYRRGPHPRDGSLERGEVAVIRIIAMASDSQSLVLI